MVFLQGGFINFGDVHSSGTYIRIDHLYMGEEKGQRDVQKTDSVAKNIVSAAFFKNNMNHTELPEIILMARPLCCYGNYRESFEPLHQGNYASKQSNFVMNFNCYSKFFIRTLGINSSSTFCLLENQKQCLKKQQETCSISKIDATH